MGLENLNSAFDNIKSLDVSSDVKSYSGFQNAKNSLGQTMPFSDVISFMNNEHIGHIEPSIHETGLIQLWGRTFQQDFNPGTPTLYNSLLNHQ